MLRINLTFRGLANFNGLNMQKDVYVDFQRLNYLVEISAY